jgi:5-methylcytosine-specific restriction endonuclease McrA
MRRKSKSKYPDDWHYIAYQIKKDAKWKCVRCGHPHDLESGYVLTVHHLDLDPQNCEWWNCPALCQRCHLSIQSKVVMEQYWMFRHTKWFRPYVAGYVAHKSGLPTDKKSVIENLDYLLEEA